MNSTEIQKSMKLFFFYNESSVFITVLSVIGVCVDAGVAVAHHLDDDLEFNQEEVNKPEYKHNMEEGDGQDFSINNHEKLFKR